MTETFESTTEIEAIIKGHLDFAERYSDLKLIGVGGMGSVFQAKDNKLDKTVAIKVLKGTGNSKPVVRFQQEARALSLLNHKYIVGVMDFQSSKNGDFFLIMERVDGDSLEKLVAAQGPLPLEDVIRYSVQLCDALEHAHVNGVVHRDLKPGNIMIDSKKHVRILDFGIAKLMQPSQFGTMTRKGMPLGTPSYMSPEQVRGDETDERTDVFGLGLLIYIMAAGRSPFDGDQVLEYYQNLIGQKPPSLRLWIGETAAAHEIDRIVAMAMQSDPNERFQNMSEMSAALSALIADPTEILRVTTQNTALKPPIKTKSRKILVPIFALIALCLCGIGYPLLSRKAAPPTVHTPVVQNKYKVVPVPSALNVDDKHAAEEAAPFYKREDVAAHLKQYVYANKKLKPEELTKLEPSVQDLSLTQLHLTPEMVKALGALSLNALDLSKTNVSDEDLKEIAKIKGLRHLSLEKTGISVRGVANLVPLRPTLIHLELDNCRRIDNSALALIIQKFPDLEALHIGDTIITRSAIPTIAKLKKLKALWLCSLRITDEDVRAISNLDYVFFDASNCPAITDETINILMPNKRLMNLDLSFCPKITKAAVMKWKAARPPKAEVLFEDSHGVGFLTDEGIYDMPEPLK